MINQIKIGAVLSYISIGVNIIAGLIYTPWMINQIGKSDYGLYTLANSLITLFLIDFGLSTATSRFVSKYVAEGEQKKANNFMGAVYKLYLIIDAVILLALTVIYFLIEKIYVNLTAEEIIKFKTVYCIAGAYAVINFPFVTLNGILTSYEKFIQLKTADIIQRLLSIALTVLALCIGLGLYALIMVNAVSGLCIIAYKLIVIKSTTPIKINFKYKDKSIYKTIFAFTFWITVDTLAARLVFNITPSILGIVANSAAIAVFGVITTIEGYAYTITSAINGIFMPKISRIYADGDDNNIMPLMIKVGRFQFALNALVIVGFALFGEIFITLWMSGAYTEAYLGILLVIFPGLFYNSLQIATTAMMVQNAVKAQALISIASGCVNVILSFFLSSIYGAIGACISIFVAYMIRAILCHIVYQRVLKLDMMLFMKKCYLRMIPSILTTLLFGIIINSFISNGGWMVFGIKIILLLLIYIITIIAFGITADEKKTLWKLCSKAIKAVAISEGDDI